MHGLKGSFSASRGCIVVKKVGSNTLKDIPMSSMVAEIAASELRPEIFQASYVRKGLPLVIRHVAQPQELFSFEEFCRETARREVSVCEYGRRRGPKWRWSRYCHRYALPVDEYVRMLGDGRAQLRDIYLSLLPIGSMESAARARRFFDNLGQHYGLQRLARDMEGYLWIGPVGHVEPLHTDEGDNTLFQVCGTKRMIIFPATQMRNLYSFPLFGPIPPWVCRVDIDHPDHQRFPGLKYALAEQQEVIIEPGDLLYLPSQWGHETTILAGAPCISLTRQWKLTPWLRNFCTTRCALYYFRRQLPRGWIDRAHGFLAALRAPRALRP